MFPRVWGRKKLEETRAPFWTHQSPLRVRATRECSIHPTSNRFRILRERTKQNSKRHFERKKWWYKYNRLDIHLETRKLIILVRRTKGNMPWKGHICSRNKLLSFFYRLHLYLLKYVAQKSLDSEVLIFPSIITGNRLGFLFLFCSGLFCFIHFYITP